MRQHGKPCGARAEIFCDAKESRDPAVGASLVIDKDVIHVRHRAGDVAAARRYDERDPEVGKSSRKACDQRGAEDGVAEESGLDHGDAAQLPLCEAAGQRRIGGSQVYAESGLASSISITGMSSSMR